MIADQRRFCAALTCAHRNRYEAISWYHEDFSWRSAPHALGRFERPGPRRSGCADLLSPTISLTCLGSIIIRSSAIYKAVVVESDHGQSLCPHRRPLTHVRHRVPGALTQGRPDDGVRCSSCAQALQALARLRHGRRGGVRRRRRGRFTERSLFSGSRHRVPRGASLRSAPPATTGTPRRSCPRRRNPISTASSRVTTLLGCV